MAKNSNRNSLRRDTDEKISKNPIDDLTDKKKLETSSNEMNSHLSDISNKLDDIQAATELGAETTEKANNDLKNTITNSLGETNYTLKELVAASELSLETLSYGLRNLGNKATTISNKLSNIFKSINKTSPSRGTSTEDQLKGTLPEAVPPSEPVIPEPFNKPNPVNNDPKNNPSDDGKGKKNNPEKPQKSKKPSKGNGINQTLITGFKALQTSSDKISSLLFDLTVSAALNTAKLVLMIAAIIFVADVIRMKFQYFSNLFETNFKKFLEFGGKLAPIYEKILAMVSTIKDVFSGKINFMDYLKQINVEYMGLIKDLAFGVEMMLAKALAGVVRYFGNNKLADTIEGAGLSDYQRHTGAVLTGEDRTLAAKYDLQQDKQARASTSEAKATYAAASPLQMQYSGVNPNQTNDPNSQRDYDDKPEDIQVKYMEDKNDVSAKVKSTSTMLDDMNYSATAIKSAAPEIADITSSYNKLKAESPDLAATVQPDYDALLKAYKAGGNSDNTNSTNAQPDNPKNSQTYISQKNISSLMMDSGTFNSGYLNPSSNNVGVTNVKTVNNNHVYRIDPRTSSSAPGMSNIALGTN